tara:strand:- start:2726 stop:4405 length:1680 start_codon:yes stop_codon:yes gene_type:complete
MVKEFKKLTADFNTYGEQYCGKYICLFNTGRYGEKVFYNSKRKLYIYKARRDIYVLGRRKGGRVIIAYNIGNPETSGWYIRDSKKSSYVFNKSMSFTDESIINNQIERSEFPDGIVVKSRYYNIDGGYLKTEKNRYNSPIYYNKEDNIYLYRLEHEWAISTEISDTYIYLKSSFIFNDIPPQDANWKKAGISLEEVDIEDNDDDAVQFGNTTLFQDKTFDAVSSSIGIDEFNDCDWVRASKLQCKNSEMKLFNMVEPNDVIQGSVGSCWLLCALSALAEFPGFFEEDVFITKDVNDAGKYELKLYDYQKQDWIVVCVDDRIPCTKKSWFRQTRPLFAKPHENEMYILLLEKAFAKLAGSYGNISGGYPVLAWLVLTGCEDLHIWSNNLNEMCWNKNHAHINRKESFNFQKLLAYKTREKNTYSSMFDYIKECDNKNYVMGASIGGSVMEQKRDDGLVERHAYSLLSAYENKNINLVCLRNPWGNEMEWNGDWSDDSYLWEHYPDIKKAVGFEKKDDGCFWMTWNDFTRIFTDIQICAKTMSTKRSAFVNHISDSEFKKK